MQKKKKIQIDTTSLFGIKFCLNLKIIRLIYCHEGGLVLDKNASILILSSRSINTRVLNKIGNNTCDNGIVFTRKTCVIIYHGY